MIDEKIGDSSGHGLTDDVGHFCPTNAALTLLNGRWTPHIVHTLLRGQTRFNEIAREIGINPRTLRERLRELEHDGVVARRVVTMMPPNVEYTLTEMGNSLGPIFTALSDWGMKWIPPPGTQKPLPSCEGEDYTCNELN
jgi:DNA-binding HxlR family transcriptional regulator